MWGRNKLQRRCSGCKRELHHSSIGDAPLFTVLLVGASSAGKTVFHRQAIRGLSAFLNAMPHTSARLDSRQQEGELKLRDFELLDSGQVPDKTTAAMQAVSPQTASNCPSAASSDVPLRFAWRRHHAGTFRRKAGDSGLDSILLLVDHFSASQTGRLRQHPPRRFGAAQTDLQTTVGNLLQVLDGMSVAKQGGKYTVPIAVNC